MVQMARNNSNNLEKIEIFRALRRLLLSILLIPKLFCLLCTFLSVRFFAIHVTFSLNVSCSHQDGSESRSRILRWSDGTKRKRLLVHEGYAYTLDKTGEDGAVYGR